MVIFPTDKANVIIKVKEDRTWVTVIALGEESSNGRSIVDDDYNEF